MLGWQLLGHHNIHFYHKLMREIRQSIFEGSFLQFYKAKRDILHSDDLDNPTVKHRPKSPKRMVLGDYEVHIAIEGFASIRHVSSGEIMHSRTPPMEEARRLYIEQADLAKRVQREGEPWEGEAAPELLKDQSDRSDLTDLNNSPLVIWDVGLGAAANAMAAIRCFEEKARTGPVRPLRIISFENDLDSLRLAWKHHDLFPYLRHGGTPALLKEGRWESKEGLYEKAESGKGESGNEEHGKAESGNDVSPRGLLGWELIQGDFYEVMGQATLPPDIIFYDMFSSKTCGHQWTLVAFHRLFAACKGKATQLFTYTCSTAARVALLAAGFYVARGRRTGEKLETTIAFTPEALALSGDFDLLGAEWLRKWHRSTAKFPAGLEPHHHPAFEQTILGHPQFAGAV
jgi:queuine tRNA-ribosyltransferase